MNVLESALRRVSFIFDEFERVVVSVSSGKDSTCLYHLAVNEAARRGRKVEVFFLDQEAEYQSTVDLMEELMRHPTVIPRWYQVPIQMTNATSHESVFLNAWHDGEEWIRPKSDISIHSLDAKYPRRFYEFFKWLEGTDDVPTAHLVGIRQFESLHRKRATSKRPGYKHYCWSTACSSDGSYRMYPIYDWHFRDVWRYIHLNNVRYNTLYDKMFAKYGPNLKTMRVSNLIHEQAFRCLAHVQEFEPETYERLLKRIGGIHCAALYANEPHIYSAEKLPKSFLTWKTYRDHILMTTPSERRERYVKRFTKQGDDEITCRHQVKQLLVNDWEGHVQRTTTKKEKIRRIWWNLL